MNALRELSKQYRVGIWGQFKVDPDDYQTAKHLINNCGVRYVNTDLPRNFNQLRCIKYSENSSSRLLDA